MRHSKVSESERNSLFSLTLLREICTIFAGSRVITFCVTVISSPFIPTLGEGEAGPPWLFLLMGGAEVSHLRDTSLQPPSEGF